VVILQLCDKYRNKAREPYPFTNEASFIYKEKHVFCGMRRKDSPKTAAIFKALLQVLQEDGVAGLQMAKIARNAGIATGTLYLYFQNKEQLLHAAFPYFGSLIYENWQPKINEKAAFEGQIRGLWLSYLQFLEQNPSFFILSELLSHSQRTELETAFLQPLKSLLEIGQAAHQLKKAPVHTLTLTLYGILHASFRHQDSDHSNRLTFQVHLLWDISWDAIRK